ncbi:MAG: hypothetical protein LBP55_00490 [Candidatus Adiutrix sp.]|jgi:predicted Fe-Mo cluster-binding NifX family protein|nr:hypothetical protein [Candidatus Adiutrix sp.]
MKIAVASSAPGREGLVPDLFSQTPWLLIINAETDELLQTVPRDQEGDLGLARAILKWNCEGILCGPIDREPFLLLADEGGVTRLQAAGLTVDQALDGLRARSLTYIKDYIGGEGHRHDHQDHAGGACGGAHHHH